MSELILYTTEDGRSQIKQWAELQTVWLTQLEMAELFDATNQNISLYLKNLFKDGELSESSVVKESLTTAAATARYLDYDHHRKQEEARLADAQDDAELQALENTLKKRPKP